jgi:hypothetical protein
VVSDRAGSTPAPSTMSNEKWKRIGRPGYFGRRRDEKIKQLNEDFGKDEWKLVWVIDVDFLGGEVHYDFEQACKKLYEASYLKWFQENPLEIDLVCSYGECIDNAPTNVDSGLDYMKQEAFSTHIQDIAVRNVLAKMGRKFEGPKDKILVIRSQDSNGFKYGPGNIPFSEPWLIAQPSKCPKWANAGSVEDFWQSNKWIMIRETQPALF